MKKEIDVIGPCLPFIMFFTMIMIFGLLGTWFEGTFNIGTMMAILSGLGLLGFGIAAHFEIKESASKN